MELIKCTDALLRAIAQKGSHQKHIAMIYQFALESSHPTDWNQVNDAIIKRWSLTGLKRVKKMAWDKAALKKVSVLDESSNHESEDAVKSTG